MKEKELRKHGTCILCRKGIMSGGVPFFYRVTIERFVLKFDALQRQQGLTMMLGGSAALAAVMGPDEDMTMPLMEPLVLTVCENCSTERMNPIAALAEKDNSHG